MSDHATMPLRVAVLARSVYPLHGYGGLERHVGDLVTHLLRRGMQVTLVTRCPTRDPARAALIEPFLRHPALDVQWVPYRTFPLAGRRGTTVLDRSSAYLWFGRQAGREAARLVRAARVDVVHGLGASALGYARARRRGAPAPFVFNPQGLEEFGGTGLRTLSARLKIVAYRPLQAAVRACADAADRVIATDRAIIPTVREFLRVEPSRIAVIPNAIDLDVLDRAAQGRRDARPQDDSRRVLLSVGRLEQNKGFHVMVAALARLRARSDWQWILVGDGPRRKTLERLAAQSGLSDRVTFTGRVADDELHGWYGAADLFVHPTLYEGSSLVTLEAMAHRKAVVATRAGGLPDKVIPGVTGWLVDPGDSRALADAVAAALDLPARLRSMGDAGRALVERSFSWHTVAADIDALYRSLLQ